jgi:vacuolar-type H+-ATPase subunit I/STV1
MMPRQRKVSQRLESTSMRSSKSRSRNKNRTQRPSGGNIINRVFDSSGPDGKVRGTPQQIIEKYNQLHRDAQLSGDRVNAENFAQHAEHYTRMLAEAQREVDQRREEMEAQNRERQAERDKERQERLQAQEAASNNAEPAPAPAAAEQPDPREAADQDSDSNLVETPEEKPAPRARKPRAPRKPRPDPAPEAAE